MFTVRSYYDRFKEKLSSPPLLPKSVTALYHLWRIKGPSEILHFGWRVILNRIATKDNLFKNDIVEILNDLFCVLCAEEEESPSHILRRCGTLSEIWRNVYKWMGILEEIIVKEFEVFFEHCDKVKRLSRRNIVAVIWLVTVWSIWLKCNVVIFNRDTFSFIECKTKINSISWRWTTSFYKLVDHCNFHLWNILQLNCFE